MFKRAVITNDEKIVEIASDRLMELDVNVPHTKEGVILIHTTVDFEFSRQAFGLNNRFNWQIAEDSAGNLLLIPLKKIP